ncbi:MAG: histidine kinase [Rhodospirillales bacterium]|jgi:DNA-binding response OmpR family regulator|nr:histidine kinase [Rhodospirillales bacterium]
MSDTIQLPPDKAAPETVVVVETDVLVRMVLADYLRECGYKVIESTNGDEVLEILNSGIDVRTVFSGAQSDSFTLAHRIRVSHPGVEIILTSSLENAAHKAAEVCDNGSQGLLTKPYNAQEVVRRIHLLRERYRTSNNPRN